jgi:hypothetical protein
MVSGWRGGIGVAARWRPGGGDWRELEVSASVIWRPCRYGGERPYLACPRCGSGRTFLILTGPALVCRVCADRPYASQREDVQGRYRRKARKAAAQLGARDWNPDDALPKPKWMRRRTYDRLLDEVADAETARHDAWTAGAAALLDRISPNWRSGDLRPPTRPRDGRRSKFWR